MIAIRLPNVSFIQSLVVIVGCCVSVNDDSLGGFSDGGSNVSGG